MSSIYDRRWSISVDGEVLVAPNPISLKCEFSITHEFGAKLVYSDIKIYNLTKNTVSEKIKRKSILSFSAGYEDNLGVIFTGVIVNTYTKRIGADLVTTILATSGIKLKNEHVVEGKTFKGSYEILEILEYIVDQMDYSISIEDDDFEETVEDLTLNNGDGFEMLQGLANKYQFDYLLEGETMVFVKYGSSREGDPIEVSQLTGMEERPTYSEAGYNVRVRLNPKFKIGGKIKIKSKNINYDFAAMNYKAVADNVGDGEYTIHKMIIIGDSHGDDWSTNLEGFIQWNG